MATSGAIHQPAAEWILAQSLWFYESCMAYMAGAETSLWVQVLETLNKAITAASPSPRLRRPHPGAQMVRMHRFGAANREDVLELAAGLGAGAAAGGAALRRDAEGVAAMPRHAAAADARAGGREQQLRRDRRVAARAGGRPAGAASASGRSSRRGVEVASRVVRAGRYRGAGEFGSADRDGEVYVREGLGLSREGAASSTLSYTGCPAAGAEAAAVLNVRSLFFSPVCVGRLSASGLSQAGVPVAAMGKRLCH